MISQLVDEVSDNFQQIDGRHNVMDGQPLSFDDVSKVVHGRSYMSNRIMNQFGVPAPTLAMRAKAPVYSTEDLLPENRVAGHSEQSIYPTYPTTFKPYI